MIVPQEQDDVAVKEDEKLSHLDVPTHFVRTVFPKLMLFDLVIMVIVAIFAAIYTSKKKDDFTFGQEISGGLAVITVICCASYFCCYTCAACFNSCKKSPCAFVMLALHNLHYLLLLILWTRICTRGVLPAYINAYTPLLLPLTFFNMYAIYYLFALCNFLTDCNCFGSFIPFTIA